MSHPDERQPRGPGLHASWQALGTVPCEALVEPRIVVEHAVRAVGHVARHVSPPGEPPGRLEWLASHHALATAVVHGSRGGRVALRPSELTLLLLDADGATLKTCPLERCTVADAAAWVRDQLGEIGVERRELPQLEASSTGGVLGRPDPEALAELERWLINGDHVLRMLARTTHGASAVRCPADRLELSTGIHHTTREGEAVRRVVAGLSLGDEHRPEPHWFVEAAPLASGARGWEVVGEADAFRKVLPGHEILQHRDATAQATAVDGFLSAAVTEAHALLHREWRRR